MLCMAISSSLFAQKKKVPDAAQKSFNKKFPAATNTSWDKEGKDNFEASFIMDGKKGSANFSGSGEWLETEMPVPVSALPPAVKDAFAKAFPGAPINTVYLVESKGGKTEYEIEYRLKGRRKEAKFSPEGKIAQ